MNEQWKITACELPPEGELVDTMTAGGLRQSLKRQGALWFVKSGDMYVYYTPVYWKPLAGGAA